jgi:acyl dehydratase
MDVVRIGETYSFHKTITDADITLYGGLVGDLGRIHFDDEFAKQTKYGRRLAAGTFMVGLMSAPQTMLGERLRERGAPPNVSYGYDRVRFPAPVFIGDTITSTLTVVEKREDKGVVLCDQKCVNQRGEVVAVATHILKFV